jgi:DNA-binding GntR family transcriptional regulator
MATSATSGDAPPSGDEGLGQREILRVFGVDKLDGVVRRIAVTVAMAIVEGELAGGADLNSVDLARQFSSSRTPVREALLVLDREGLVEIPPRKRPRVRGMTLTEVRDMYELRAGLYTLVSRRIVAVCDDVDMDRLRLAHARLEDAARAGDSEAYFWRIVDFRNAEAEIAGNGAVRAALDSIALRTLRIRHVSLSLPGRVETSVDDHRRLMQAYEDREGELAAALSRSILHRGLAALEASGVLS